MKFRVLIAATVAVMSLGAPPAAAAPPGPPPAPGLVWLNIPGVGDTWISRADAAALCRPAAAPTAPTAPAPVPAAGCPDGKCPLRAPAAATAGVSPVASTPQRGEDALAEVNAKRAARGLRPYLHDPLLTQAARACAAFRAQHRLFGHVMTGRGDFGFLPPGARCAATGCAAYPASYGWMSCCVNDSYTYAGAAWVMGVDGKRYMSLFCR
jgi:hypothetical protein